MRRLAVLFAEFIPGFPVLDAISFGGGIPFNYRAADDQASLEPLRALLEESRANFCRIAGRDVRLEIEPGRYLVGAVSDVGRARVRCQADGNKRAGQRREHL